MPAPCHARGSSSRPTRRWTASLVLSLSVLTDPSGAADRRRTAPPVVIDLPVAIDADRSTDPSGAIRAPHRGGRDSVGEAPARHRADPSGGVPSFERSTTSAPSGAALRSRDRRLGHLVIGL